MDSWEPSLYLKFGSERTRPAVDLVSRIEVADPRRVIDLGCGPGNSTAVLRARWPAAEITGLDSDPAMLAAATASDPSIRWVQGDVARWEAQERYEVVFSNAMLQWVPDHATIVPRLMSAVQDGGALAVQVPTHLESALHRHILEIAILPQWRDATQSARSAIVTHHAGFYYDLLCNLAARIDLWETEYDHVMDGPADILTWIRGTGLRPFLSALNSDDERRQFESLLLDRLTESYRPQRDGRILFPFRRLFFVAYRGRGERPKSTKKSP